MLILLGLVAHAFNLSSWGAESGRSMWAPGHPKNMQRVPVKENEQQSSTPWCQRKESGEEVEIFNNLKIKKKKKRQRRRKPNWAPYSELQHLSLPSVTTTHGQLKSKITTHKNSGIIICKFRSGDESWNIILHHTALNENCLWPFYVHCMCYPTHDLVDILL